MGERTSERPGRQDQTPESNKLQEKLNSEAPIYETVEVVAKRKLIEMREQGLRREEIAAINAEIDRLLLEEADVDKMQNGFLDSFNRDK